MRKKIITALAGLALLLTSCEGVFEGGYNMNNAEGLKELKTEFTENFGADKEVYNFSMTASDHMTSEFGSAKIKYLEDGLSFSRDYNGTLEVGKRIKEPVKANEAFQKDFFLKKNQGKLKVKDLDFSFIVTKFNEACALISSEYHDFTLYSWSYEVSNDNAVSSDFTIEGTKKGESTQIEGRNVVTNYYEFKFQVDKEGKILIED